MSVKMFIWCNVRQTVKYQQNAMHTNQDDKILFNLRKGAY